MLGFLAVPIAKLAGLGTLTKAAAAVSTAALTMTVAGGAAGVLQPPDGPSPGEVVVQHAAPQASASAGSVTSRASSTASVGTPAPTTTGAKVTTPIGSGSAQASTASSSAPAAAANLPRLPAAPVPAVPALPALPGCVANLVSAGGTAPDPIRLVSQLPVCILSVVKASLPLDAIRSAIGSAGLPAEVSACLSSVLSSVPGLAGGDLSGLQQVLSDCLPTGTIPGGGTFSGMGPFPGIGSFSGVRANR